MSIKRYPLLAIAAVWLSFAAVFAASPMVAANPVSQTEQTDEKSASVNLNSATAEELAEKLVGVGAARAELIVQYRDANGPFTSIEQLLEIKGIGVATLEKNRDKIEL